MNLRTWARVLIAVAFFIWGLVETLGATGLVVELSPDGRWGTGVHAFAVGGPVQMVGAALLVLGRKTRWALTILGCYVLLASVFGNLPLILDPILGRNALIGLLINSAIMGGIMYWFYGERMQSAYEVEPVMPTTPPAPTSTVRLVLCLALIGGILYWLHGERLAKVHRSRPLVPVTNPAPTLPVKLLA